MCAYLNPSIQLALYEDKNLMTFASPTIELTPTFITTKFTPYGVVMVFCVIFIFTCAVGEARVIFCLLQK